MSIIWNVYKQLPKVRKTPLVGTLDCDRQGRMILWDKEECIIMELHSITLHFIGADGFMFKGYEPDGFDKRGVPKFKYQEWWCCPIKLEEK